MTTKQKAALAVVLERLDVIAGELATAKQVALAKAMELPPGPLGTSPFEAGWLGSTCEGRARELRALIGIARESFPSVAAKKEAA